MTGESRRRVILLGPQHDRQTVATAVGALGVEGPLAIVTAGWEDREGDDAPLSEHLGQRTRNLGLFPRAEDVFESDAAIRSLMYEQHDRRQQLQALYRLRLAPQLEACRKLFDRTDPANPDDLIGPEIDSALLGIRALDDHHLQRITALDAEISERLTATEMQVIDHHRGELAGLLDDAGALLIAGGNVGTMLNRLRFFDVMSLAQHLPIVAWSGGAMVLTDRVVLFHDSPPQGPGDAEVYAPGLGIVHGVVALPHAHDRLRLGDVARIALFARRFAPDVGLVLDSGDHVEWREDDPEWMFADGTRTLRPDGQVIGMAVV